MNKGTVEQTLEISDSVHLLHIVVVISAAYCEWLYALAINNEGLHFVTWIASRDFYADGLVER